MPEPCKLLNCDYQVQSCYIHISSYFFCDNYMWCIKIVFATGLLSLKKWSLFAVKLYIPQFKWCAHFYACNVVCLIIINIPICSSLQVLSSVMKIYQGFLGIHDVPLLETAYK